MADIDLDTLEEIMKKEKEKDKDNDRKSRSHRRSSRSKSRSRSRDHSKKYSHSSSKTKHHSSEHRQKDGPSDPARRQQELLEKQIEEARKQAEEAQRDDCTVLVQRINLDADERDIYKLFAAANVGKVRDVRIVRDLRSGRSKGVGYVEFYTPESVLMAMTLTGTKFKGQEIVVQASQAEKNRAAAAAKFKKETQEQLHPSEQSEGAMRISVEGLGELLFGLTESDLFKLFSPFGAIEAIDLPKKDVDGRFAEGSTTSMAFVQFKRAKDGREAMHKMHGIRFKGKTLNIAMANEGLKPSRPGEYVPSTELEAEEKGQNISNLETRQALMQKLTRGGNETGMIPPRVSMAERSVSNEPSHCLLLANLFDANAVDLKLDPMFFLDIKDDVIGACEEFGKVEYAWVDQGSNGNVWVKFADKSIGAATKTLERLNGRFFAGRKVTANFVPQAVFQGKVGSVPS